MLKIAQAAGTLVLEQPETIVAETTQVAEPAQLTPAPAAVATQPAPAKAKDDKKPVSFEWVAGKIEVVLTSITDEELVARYRALLDEKKGNKKVAWSVLSSAQIVLFRRMVAALTARKDAFSTKYPVLFKERFEDEDDLWLEEVETIVCEIEAATTAVDPLVVFNGTPIEFEEGSREAIREALNALDEILEAMNSDAPFGYCSNEDCPNPKSAEHHLTCYPCFKKTLPAIPEKKPVVVTIEQGFGRKGKTGQNWRDQHEVDLDDQEWSGDRKRKSKRNRR